VPPGARVNSRYRPSTTGCLVVDDTTTRLRFCIYSVFGAVVIRSRQEYAIMEDRCWYIQLVVHCYNSGGHKNISCDQSCPTVRTSPISVYTSLSQAACVTEILWVYIPCIPSFPTSCDTMPKGPLPSFKAPMRLREILKWPVCKSR
jgi:hypothetical protein